MQDTGKLRKTLNEQLLRRNLITHVPRSVQCPTCLRVNGYLTFSAHAPAVKFLYLFIYLSIYLFIYSFTYFLI